MMKFIKIALIYARVFLLRMRDRAGESGAATQRTSSCHQRGIAHRRDREGADPELCCCD